MIINIYEHSHSPKIQRGSQIIISDIDIVYRLSIDVHNGIEA